MRAVHKEPWSEVQNMIDARSELYTQGYESSEKRSYLEWVEMGGAESSVFQVVGTAEAITWGVE